MKKQSVIEEGGFFTLSSSNLTEDELIQKICTLRSEDYVGPIDLYDENVDWTEKLSLELICTLRYYKERGEKWRLVSFQRPHFNTHCNRLIQSVVEVGIFETLHLESQYVIDQTLLSSALGQVISFVLQNGKLLDVVITGFRLGSDAAEHISLGLSHSHGMNGPKSLFMKNSFEDSPCGRTTMDILADGLKNNRKLEEIHMVFCDYDDANRYVSPFLKSLIGNPVLKILHVECSQFNQSSIPSLCQLLGDKRCNLEQLSLDGVCEEEQSTSFQIETFMNTLECAHSLKKLWFVGFDDLNATKACFVLGNIRKFPKLEMLDLSECSIDSFEKLTAWSEHTTSSHLSVLNIDDNDWNTSYDSDSMENKKTEISKESNFVLRLLSTFPALGDLGIDFYNYLDDGFYDDRVVHKFDMNRCLNVLLQDKMLPLGIWPIVIAGVREKLEGANPARQSNVIYHILHGQAFAGRLSFD